MARNIAKRFATMTLLYWHPNYKGGSLRYDEPIEFKGFYMTNVETHGGGVADMVGANEKGNLVLFYMCEPKQDGYVSWVHTLESLNAEGKLHIHPGELEDTHKLKRVTEYAMLRTRKRELKSLAFIANID